MNKYKKNNFFIVISVSALYVLIAMLVYSFYFHDYENKEYQKESIYIEIKDEKIINELNLLIKDKALDNIAKQEKDIEDLNTINKEEKLYIAYKSIVDKLDNPKENGIEINTIDEYFKNTFKRTMYWDKENIMCDCGGTLYKYDSTLNKYIYNEEHLAHDNTNIMSNYSKILKVEKKNQIYQVTMTYIWLSNNEDKVTAYKNKEILFEIDITDSKKDINNYITNEIEKNYEQYKDKLHKYVYYFEKANDNYLLINFDYKK